jgi:NAD(P)-dependent dehydrogenase (short-subunit alcohol dehydrogenase family)
MAERGHGVVVNVSTLGATLPGQGAGIYGATKAGLELLTKVWADEFGTAGVRVNAASAGPTMTPGTAIANAVTFLASSAASYVNGAIRQVSGGIKAISPDVTP